MKIERKNINLITETFAYIYGISNEDIAAVFKMEVIKHINYINSLLDVDFKTLSDGNFYNLLCKVYNIKLESEDYLKIISKKNGRKYDRCLTLDTTMLIDVLGNSEKLQDKRVYQVAYLVAVSHESEIDSNQIFSKNEIKKLIDDGDIVILQERKRPIIGNFVPREEEIYEKFFGENIDFNGHILRDENFSIVVSMLRKNL